jgi:hypothetical protein
VADLLALVPRDSRHIVDILLVKWQEDGDYLQTMLDMLHQVEYQQYIWTRGPMIVRLLELIQKKTSYSEQIQLMKALLDPSHIPQNSTKFPCPVPEELYCLIDASNRISWAGAKETLGWTRVLSTAIGQRAFECALVALAEKHLRKNKRIVQERHVACGEACEEYLRILNDFEGAEIDVDQSWYKHALQIRNHYDMAARKSIRASSIATDENVLKYRKLIVSYTGIAENNIDGMLDELLKTETGKLITHYT